MTEGGGVSSHLQSELTNKAKGPGFKMDLTFLDSAKGQELRKLFDSDAHTPDYIKNGHSLASNEVSFKGSVSMSEIGYGASPGTDIISIGRDRGGSLGAAA
jgi:hypothetical protein